MGHYITKLRSGTLDEWSILEKQNDEYVCLAEWMWMIRQENKYVYENDN